MEIGVDDQAGSKNRIVADDDGACRHQSGAIDLDPVADLDACLGAEGQQRRSARRVADPNILTEDHLAGTANPEAGRGDQAGSKAHSWIAQAQVGGAQAHALEICPGRDLNPYKLALTAPSKLRVYQFHHPGKGEGDCTPRRSPISHYGWAERPIHRTGRAP
jgi:hypothetical protein